MVAERKEGRSMEQCWLLGGEALKPNFWNGKRGRPGMSQERMHCCTPVFAQGRCFLSLMTKSVFQEFNEPTSSMEGVQAGL